MKIYYFLSFILGMATYGFVPTDQPFPNLPSVHYNQKFIVNQLGGGNTKCVTYGWYTQDIASPKYHTEMECGK